MRDKVFNVAKNPKYNEYQRRLALMMYKCIDKKISGAVIKNEIMSIKKLAEELQRPISGNFEKQKITLIFYKQYLGY